MKKMIISLLVLTSFSVFSETCNGDLSAHMKAIGKAFINGIPAKVPPANQKPGYEEAYKDMKERAEATEQLYIDLTAQFCLLQAMDLEELNEFVIE